jgi:hypothetical protein
MSEIEGNKKPYQPSEEEMKKAEEMMTDVEKEKSAHQEFMLNSEHVPVEILPDGSIQIKFRHNDTFQGSPEEAIQELDKEKYKEEETIKKMEKEIEDRKESSRVLFEKIKRMKNKIRELAEK